MAGALISKGAWPGGGEWQGAGDAAGKGPLLPGRAVWPLHAASLGGPCAPLDTCALNWVYLPARWEPRTELPLPECLECLQAA